MIVLLITAPKGQNQAAEHVRIIWFRQFGIFLLMFANEAKKFIGMKIEYITTLEYHVSRNTAADLDKVCFSVIVE